MSEHYTDDDVETAYRAWIGSGSDVRGSIKEMFDAVAPAIAARALRRLADDLSAAPISLAINAGQIREYADEIEATP